VKSGSLFFSSGRLRRPETEESTDSRKAGQKNNPEGYRK
jgi:hypothetical protein